ncbi:solute carrier family 2, facilitated glucose transporter member 8 isoform X3 [Rana temporaria]|uniref:solute carrier family 2, facilitated glucose transporter member 8 isoform X3 n=1 Tax=Rana temporaria TaxID=8407 RepID=UPI001AAD8A06|nr:solute carrier family 2, facilitated glucose transporter member 8 isoform X3 [Rana temporaria]
MATRQNDTEPIARIILAATTTWRLRKMDGEDLQPLLVPSPTEDQLTHQSSYLRKVRNRNLYLATLAAVLGPLSFGFVLGFSSPAISDLKNADDPRLILDKGTASWFGVYISETSHPRVRGLLGSCVQLMVVTGIVGSYIAGMFLDWRWLAVLCSVPPVIMALFMIFMPETPRYLISQNKRAEALSALSFLRGPNVDHEWEYRQIESSADQKEGSLKVTDLWNPSIYKPFLIGIFLMFFQQFTGINAIMFYADMIFEEANFKNSSLASVIVGLIQVVFTAVAALIMDRAGRKILLIISGTIMAVSATLFGVYFKIMEMHAQNASSVLPVTAMPDGTGEQLAWLPLASMALFISGFAIGWGPIPWLVMSEIFPLRARGVASGVCVITNWGCAFLVTKEFQDMMDSMTSYGTFWLFAAICALNVLFTVLYVPETKGKSLEQIESHFQSGQSTTRFGSFSNTIQ